MKVNALKELIQRIDGKKEDSFYVICTYSLKYIPDMLSVCMTTCTVSGVPELIIVEKFYRRSSRRSTQSPSFLLVACNAAVLVGSAS